MARYILLCLFPLILYFQITFGQWAGESAACRTEHGACTKHVYENIRLTALRSSGCQKFCQCVHASTELDGSVTYMWVEQQCPPTTLFDDSLPAPVCNHAANVQCTGTYDEDCSCEHGACTQFIYENVRLVAQTSTGCKKFCQCAHASTQLDGSVTYHWVEHTCPAGTLFDSKLRVCNHADNVQCTGSGHDNSGLNGSPTSQPSGGQVPIVSGDNECFEEYGSCTKHQYENVRLVALKSSGCKSFCHCAYASTEIDGSVTYKWVKKTCPANTLFDEIISVCNHDYDVQCQKEESEDCKSEHGACFQFVYENVRLVAKTNSGCKKFCQCAHASTQLDGSVTYHWVEHTCPAGTLFDKKIRVCNHADNVQCTGSGQDNSGSNGSPTSQLSGGQVPIVSGYNECFEEYGSCTKHQYENVRLVALKSSGCKNFCQCAYASTEIDGSVTYKWVKKTCPANTLFDESLSTPVCNHDYYVQCQSVGDKKDGCLNELGTCTKSEYEVKRLAALRSSGCKKFCQCAHASTELNGSVTYYWEEHTCPKNTLFDESLPTPVCNWAYNVQC
ncbi:uncharacterized protein LOC132728494 isoform X3 [Ruditapes philippinarum]|uniref:uncharacterized protein LOC132728494 isoform X3 n=1 Tax=Ruditapes philippinarum TaxID=129788 RepID=UPI00295A5D1F|nr:uncharacterized protein LOC132728494 isoform X3 [Ruditapes philippinarum]